MGEEIKEGKYVASRLEVLSYILKMIEKKVTKEIENNQEKGIAIMNQLGSYVKAKVTDKKQVDNKLFLKFGDEPIHEDAAVDAANLKAKQAEEVERLKAKHETEVEALKDRHEREMRAIDLQKEKETANKAIEAEREAARKQATNEEKLGNKHDNGVLEAGTDEIRQSYQEDTPGQDTEQFIKEKDKAFHEQKKQVKKNFSDVFGNPLKGYPANEEIKVREL